MLVVLLVDDNASTLKVLKTMLEPCHGFEILEAPGAEEALELADRHHIDVLITDVVMPGIDGETLAERMIARSADLPVLFISGCPIDPTLKHARYLSAFLQKPFDKRDLINAVYDLCGPPVAA
jgi:CheY-like chemotaxis protein